MCFFFHVCAFKESDDKTDHQQTDVDLNDYYSDKVKNEDNLESKNEDDPLDFYKKKEPADDEGHGPYVPGSLTEPDKRHDTYDLLVKDAVEKIHGPQEDDSDKFWRKVAENAQKDEEESMRKDKGTKPLKLPKVNVSQNFEFAKRMHVGNLEHQPLPDTLGYRNLTKIAEHRDSDIVVKPYAIGWKGYGASGPTCCTKLRIHRPKTCEVQKADGDRGDDRRPSTSAPNLGGQYQKPLSLMDLAICWDFKPDDPKKEQKPPKHIDGSNGSKAPAVFTMVHTPKETTEDIEHVHAHSQPIFIQNRVVEDQGRHPVPYFEKDMSKEKRKDSCEVQYCPQHNGSQKGSKASSTRNSAQSATKPKCDGVHGCGTPSETSRKSSRDDSRPEKLQPIKEAWNVNDVKNYDMKRNRNSLESYEKTPLAQGKLHQSSPNDSQTLQRSNKNSDLANNNVKHKTCLSCNGTKIVQVSKQKEDYKFAFKAGNPNSVTGSNNSSTDSKGIKIPKMRHPYTKKNYTIPTLAPPFSIWRDANATGYPEHWRLASVYQHAYKPPEQRRKPLIASVFQ